jgi:hypothetical protein
VKQILLAISAAAICWVSVCAADDNIPVKITGCVMKGDKGSFVLTNVYEMSGTTMSPTSSIYFLSTNKGLKNQVGHKVEVIGSFSPSRDNGKVGEIIIASDPATGQKTIEVEHGAEKAEVVNSADVSGTTGVKTEVTKPYRRLEVQKLRRIGDRCNTS